MNLSDKQPVVDYSRAPQWTVTPRMSIASVVLIVSISTFATGMIGALIGFLMGSFIPDFYRYGPGGGSPESNPVEVGTGLGFVEGLAAGFLLGALIVCVRAFGKRK